MAPEKKIFEIPDYEDAPLTDEELFRFRIGETDCALVRADYLTPERVDGVDQSDIPAIMRAVAADEVTEKKLARTPFKFIASLFEAWQEDGKVSVGESKRSKS